MVRGFDLPTVLRARALSHQMPPPVWLGSGTATVLAHELSDHLAEGLSGMLASQYDDGGTIAWLLAAGYENLFPLPDQPSNGSNEALDIQKKRFGVEAHKIALNVEVSSGWGPTIVMPADPVEVHSYRAPHWDVARFTMIFNGNSQVINAIVRGDPRLAQSRQVPGIARYFERMNQQQLDSITIAEEVKLADALISETIRMAGNQLGVGGQIDIATITPEAGFQWVAGHDPKTKIEPNGEVQHQTLELINGSQAVWQLDRSIVIKRVRIKLPAARQDCAKDGNFKVMTRWQTVMIQVVGGNGDSGPVDLDAPVTEGVIVQRMTPLEGCKTPPDGGTVKFDYFLR